MIKTEKYDLFREEINVAGQYNKIFKFLITINDKVRLPLIISKV